MIVNIALKEVTKLTKNEITIGDIWLRPFSCLELSDVYISDLKKDTLLHVKDFSVDFSLLPLLKSKLQISSVELNDFTIHLAADSIGGNFNFQFFIDAFQSDKVDTTTSPDPFKISIDNILLNNGKIAYDIYSEPIVYDGFDYSHIHITDFRLATDFSFTTVEDFIVKLKHLSLKERSGFRLQELSANISADKGRMMLSDFIFRLTKSEIHIPEAYLDYSATSIDSITLNAKYSLPINRFVLYPSEVAMFYLPLEGVQDSIQLEANAEGTFPAINLSSFHFMYGSTLTIDASAYTDSYIEWQSAPLELSIGQLFFKPYRVNSLVQQLTLGKQSQIVPINSSYVSVKAKVRGTLANLQVGLNANTSSGDLKIEGVGGYVYSTGDAHVNAQLETDNLSLGELLSNPLLGIAAMTSSVKGSVTGDGSIAATLTANINRFDFKKYSYHDIYADILYAGDSLHLLAKVNDHSLPIQLQVKGENISSKNPYFSLEAEANHVLLDSLNLLPQYKGADLTARIQAEVRGIDLEQMQARIAIDSLRLKTEKGIFAQDFVRLEINNEQDGFKSMKLNAPMVDANAKGSFTISTLLAKVSNTLSKYFGAFIPYREVEGEKEQVDLDITIRNTEKLAQALNLPFTISDSLIVKAHYHHDAIDGIGVSINTPSIVVGNTQLGRTTFAMDRDSLTDMLSIIAGTMVLSASRDTMRLGMSAKAHNDSINLKVLLNDATESLALFGFVDANVFIQPIGEAMPNIDIDLNPGVIAVNKQKFTIKPAKLMARKDGYHINGLELDDAAGGFFRVDGLVSASSKDTVKVSIGNLHLSTILAALQSDINLKGIANGDIKATKVLEQPLVFTNNLVIDSIALSGEHIGRLSMRSAWSKERQGMSLGATLEQGDSIASQIKGYILPKQDQMSIKADLNHFQVRWLQPITKDYLFGLSGRLGLQLSAEGSISTPVLSGMLSFDDAGIGVSKTGVEYKISDTVYIKPDSITFGNFRIYDKGNNTATLNGGVRYSGNFSDYWLGMNMRLNNFSVLDNINQTDSMVYGKLNLNGSVDVSGTKEMMLVKGSISNSGSGKVFLQLLESAATAKQYAGITYISTSEDGCIHIADSIVRVPEVVKKVAYTLPLRAEVALTLSPELVASMIIDPAAGDYASVNGSGNIQFIYDMAKDDMSLLGEYTVEKGNAAFAFQNVLKKQFLLAQGGKVSFRGDPLDTKFSATAVYNLKTDLATLDESFLSDPYLSSSNVQVNCLINISGDINRMGITYSIEIQGVDESVQRKVDGLIYNDDLRIKQIAYLLAMGRFYPPEGVVGASSGPTTWTSFLSSTLSSQLNGLLDNVLNENWTVGTELRTGEDSKDDLEANVVVSANLFKNRITVTTSLGYKNTAANSDFTGDFSVEGKLTKRGDLIVKAYNVTNDQFYEQAPTTQGVGIVYKREAKRFKGLFRKWRRRVEDAGKPKSIETLDNSNKL